MDTLPPLQRGKGIFVNLTLDGICRLHLSGGHAKILLRIYEEAARWRDKDRSAAPKKAGDAMEKRQKTSLTMCLVAIGIVYGDIGTSPLYVMKSILEGNGGITQINESFIVGALSLIIWTITLLTTVKYVLIAMRADNNGEGGIFSLYALVKKDRGASFYPIIAACKRELDEEKRCCGQTAAAYLKLLLIEIYRALPSVSRAGRASAVAGVKTYIEAHCNEDISLDSICRKFYMNKTNLLHSFKREFGTSPVRYLNNYRIERSKALLADGESVTSAALAVGFSNPVYFTELFHRRTGLTPSAFKKISEKNSK